MNNMILITCSKITHQTIQSSLGKSEYSYFFLLNEFLPALKNIAEVVLVENTEAVDPLYHKYRKAGQTVFFLSVSPPHQTPLHLQCPTVCLFAWEFYNVPDQPWNDEPRNDWRYALKHMAGAIACSQESAQAVRQALGPDYPVAAIPAPIWNRFQDLHQADASRPIGTTRSFSFSGHAIDSPLLGLSANGLVQHWERHPPAPPRSTPPQTTPNAWQRSWKIACAWQQALLRSRQRKRKPEPLGVQPAPSPIGLAPVQDFHFDLDGVVFCSVFNPSDGRKNWDDIVTAFCWAFRDTQDATLILKMTHHDLESYRIFLLTLLSRLAPFQCRVLVLHGFLDDEKYRELVQVCNFYVNASNGEGLCLPLMEFLSSGKPALAPHHSAMSDYIDENIAVVVESSPELACWSHDPSGLMRTQRHRIHWQSLMEGYRRCYAMARNEPDIYQQMSQRAWEKMRDFSNIQVISQDLATFFSALVPNTTPATEVHA